MSYFYNDTRNIKHVNCVVECRMSLLKIPTRTHQSSFLYVIHTKTHWWLTLLIESRGDGCEQWVCPFPISKPHTHTMEFSNTLPPTGRRLIGLRIKMELTQYRYYDMRRWFTYRPKITTHRIPLRALEEVLFATNLLDARSLYLCTIFAYIYFGQLSEIPKKLYTVIQLFICISNALPWRTLGHSHRDNDIILNKKYIKSNNPKRENVLNIAHNHF